MNQKLKAVTMALFIRPYNITREPLTRATKAPVKTSWRVTYRWYSPFAWVYFVLALARGLVMGAVYGFFGAVKGIANPSKGTFSTITDFDKPFNWYKYY